MAVTEDRERDWCENGVDVIAAVDSYGDEVPLASVAERGGYVESIAAEDRSADV